MLNILYEDKSITTKNNQTYDITNLIDLLETRNEIKNDVNRLIFEDDISELYFSMLLSSYDVIKKYGISKAVLELIDPNNEIFNLNIDNIPATESLNDDVTISYAEEQLKNKLTKAFKYVIDLMKKSYDKMLKLINNVSKSFIDYENIIKDLNNKYKKIKSLDKECLKKKKVKIYVDVGELKDIGNIEKIIDVLDITERFELIESLAEKAVNVVKETNDDIRNDTIKEFTDTANDYVSKIQKKLKYIQDFTNYTIDNVDLAITDKNSVTFFTISKGSKKKPKRNLMLSEYTLGDIKKLLDIGKTIADINKTIKNNIKTVQKLEKAIKTVEKSVDIKKLEKENTVTELNTEAKVVRLVKRYLVFELKLMDVLTDKIEKYIKSVIVIANNALKCANQ